MTDIHKIELGPGRFMWLLVEDEPYGEPFVAGPNPATDMADRFARLFGNSPEDKLYGLIRRELRGKVLEQRSLFWMRIYDSGHVDIKKDRERCAHPPFRTLEEMKIVSAVNGWTDPAWLYDVATEAAAKIARRNGATGEKPVFSRI